MMKLMGWKKMIEFKTNLKVTISAEYTISIKEKKSVFSTTYSASVKQDVIDRRMRLPGTKFPSRFVDEQD